MNILVPFALDSCKANHKAAYLSIYLEKLYGAKKKKIMDSQSCKK